MNEFSVGNLVDLIGPKFPWMSRGRLSERLQHWTRIGLLRTSGDPATGTGSHRLYERDQALYAVILMEFSCYNLQTRELAAIVRFLNQIHGVDMAGKRLPPKVRLPLEAKIKYFQAAQGGTPVVLVYLDASKYPRPIEGMRNMAVLKFTDSPRDFSLLGEWRSALMVRLDQLFGGL